MTSARPIYALSQNLARGFARGLFDVEIRGLENVPSSGPLLICANHVSYLDPPLLGGFIPGEIQFLARKTLFDHWFTGWLYRQLNSIPVDQEKADMSSLKTILRKLKENWRVLLFPEGTRSPDGQLGQAEPGIGFLVAKSRAPILPVRIFGAEKALPKGSSTPQRTAITIVFDEPFEYDFSRTEADSKKLYQEIADTIMERIASIQINPLQS